MSTARREQVSSYPPYEMSDFVLEHHLITARTTVDLFGIADPEVFDAKLEKLGCA